MKLHCISMPNLEGFKKNPATKDFFPEKISKTTKDFKNIYKEFKPVSKVVSFLKRVQQPVQQVV